MADKLRRILYSQAPRGGGSTISLYELIKGLDTTKYEPLVLFLHDNQYLENFKKLGVKTFTLNSIKYKNRKQTLLGGFRQLVWADIPLAFRIARLLKTEKIDLVHHNFGFDRIIMMAAGLTRTQQVCHFRNFNKTIPLTVKVLLSSVAAAFYTTQAIADHYLGLGGGVARQLVVYEPIDVRRFAEHQGSRASVRRQFSVDDAGYLISNIGRVTPWKGQDYFLQALPGIVARYPKVKALIVGAPGETGKDEQYLESLQDMVKALSLQNHVVFTGNRSDIPEIMAASDIVVHSACKPEPFGLVIAEAMASGTPVIATRGGGTAEIIEDGVTGLLVPMASADALQEAIDKLLASDELRERIRTKAQETVTQRFSIERHVAKVQTMYEDLFSQALPATRQ